MTVIEEMTFCEMHKKSGGCKECPNRWVCKNSPLKVKMFKYIDGNGEELTHDEAFTCSECGQKADDWSRGPWRTIDGESFCELTVVHGKCGFMRDLQVIKPA